MNIVLSPAYQELSSWIESVPSRFNEGEGQLLHDGRNQIRLFERNGLRIVAKRYKRHDCFKQLVYTFFRKNKARRSYENAVRLGEMGFDTPEPIAFIETRRHGLIRQVYYLCEFTDAQPVRTPLIDTNPFDQGLACDYANFVATLHEHGVLHRDLNPTNVLYTDTDEHHHFTLIDINRMKFYAPNSVPKDECMENLTLFWRPTEIYHYVLNEYAIARGWTTDDIEKAMQVKYRHDRSWDRRKKFTSLFKMRK